MKGRFKSGSFTRSTNKLIRLMMYIATDPNTAMVITISVKPVIAVKRQMIPGRTKDQTGVLCLSLNLAKNLGKYPARANA